MPKYRLPFTKDDFFFNERDKRLFKIAIRVAGGAAVLLVIAALTAGAIAGHRRERNQTADARPTDVGPMPAPFAAQQSAADSRISGAKHGAASRGEGEKPLSIGLFITPDEIGTLPDNDVVFFRPRSGRWDRAAVDLFWVPPKRIGLDNLKKANDKNSERLFEDVP